MTRRAAVALVSSLCLFVAVGVHAQGNSVRRDPEAVALLSRSIQLLTNGTTVRDLALTGSVRRTAGSQDETGQLSAKALSNGEMRVEYAYPSGTQSESRTMSGDRAVENWGESDGAVEAVAPHNVAPLAPWFAPTVLLAAVASDSSTSLQYVGKERKSGHDVEHLTVAKQVPALRHPKVILDLLQKAARVDLYLDATSGVPVAIAYNTHPDKNLGQDIPVEIRFSDYHLVQGAQVAYRIQKYLNRTRLLDIKVNTANLN